MALETFPFDAADYITSPATAATFLADAMESGDSRVVADAIEVLARASERGVRAPHPGDGGAPALAEGGGLPSFESVTALLRALGVKLTPTPVAGDATGLTRFNPPLTAPRHR